jgi:hypothetical protein
MCGQRKEQARKSKDHRYASTESQRKGRRNISERQHKTSYEEDIFT